MIPPTQNLPGQDLKNHPSEMEEHTVVQLINTLLTTAINQGASDLHFEPYDTFFRLRARQDGILKEVAQFPLKLAPRVSSRLKIMSGLDISERRLPQDGRFKMNLSQTIIVDFRVSTCPTIFGEKVVLRILDPRATQFNIEQLGCNPTQQALLLNYIHQPQGLCLFTGPTGSGKTTSLYTIIKQINALERNIVTCEDPVEISLPGINQVNVHTKAGLGFSKVLRSLLRQDPDVLMIGEIRDPETASIAIEAAHTGHLVFSSLHTNSASETIERLTHLGLPPYSIANTLTLVIAQRLARQLCEFCKSPTTAKKQYSESFLLQLGLTNDECSNLQFYQANGCAHCRQGYHGRIGLYEILPITPFIASLIMKQEHAHIIHQAALNQGMQDLKQSALNKVKSGFISLEELCRVINIV